MFHALFCTVFLLLSVRSTKASLPYSIPDLGYDLVDRRDIVPSDLQTFTPLTVPTGTASISPITVSSALISLQTSVSLTHPVLASSESHPSTSVSIQVPQETAEPSKSFFLNTTIFLSSTVGLTSGIIPSSRPSPDDNSSASLTPLISAGNFSTGTASSSAALSSSSNASLLESILRSLLEGTVLASTSSTTSSESSSSISSPVISTAESISSKSTIKTSDRPSLESSDTDLSSTKVHTGPIIITSVITASGGSPATVFITTTSVLDQTGIMSNQAPLPSASNPSQLLTGILGQGSNVQAKIGDVVYRLPSDDNRSIEVLLPDGAFATLFASKIGINGEYVPIPSNLNNPAPVQLNGHSIVFNDGQSTQPPQNQDDDHHGGGGGIFGALAGLAGGVATGAGGALAGAATGLKGFAGGGAAAVVSAPVSGAQGAIGNVVSSLHGIQKAFPTEKLSKAGIDTFSNALNLGQQSFNQLTSLQALLPNFDNLKPNLQEQVRKKATRIPDLLEQTIDAVDALKDFPWDETQVPTATPDPTASNRPTDKTSMQSTALKSTSSKDNTISTSTQTPSGTQSQSTTPSSSQISSSATPTPTPNNKVEYVIKSKEGTTKEQFEQLMQDLDQKQGTFYDLPSFESQMYLVELNASQAEEVPRRYPFISFISINAIDESIDGSYEFFRAPYDTKLPNVGFLNRKERDSVAEMKETISKMIVPRQVREQKGATWWKKAISAPPPLPNVALSDPAAYPEYYEDDSAGKGATIYILDDGFDITLPDLQAETRKIEHIVAPNRIAVPRVGLDDLGRERGGPEDITNGDHGTMMAIIAAGRIHGVASNADLVLVKTKNKYKRKFPPYELVFQGLVQTPAIIWCLDRVRIHIQERLAKDPRAKSVINMSWGYDTRPEIRPASEVNGLRISFKEFLDFCSSNNVLVVVAAGNKQGGPERVQDNLPQQLGQQGGSMVVVGAVDQGYKVWSGSADDPTGLITLYAPGENIAVQKNGGVLANEYERAGTSHAAAIVAGIGAYYFGLAKLEDHEYEATAVQNIKKMLVDNAWVRKLDNQPSSNHPVPLRVVYNLVHRLSCVNKRGIFRRDVSGACTIASTLSTSVTSSLASSSAFSTSGTMSQNVTQGTTSEPLSTVINSKTSSLQTPNESLHSSLLQQQTTVSHQMGSSALSKQESHTPTPTPSAPLVPPVPPASKHTSSGKNNLHGPMPTQSRKLKASPTSQKGQPTSCRFADDPPSQCARGRCRVICSSVHD